MKKFVFGMLVAVVCCAALTGCDDSGQKIGGGGLMQSFDKTTEDITDLQYNKKGKYYGTF